MADLWLPEESIYLAKQIECVAGELSGDDLRPNRPWNQGDVFLGVPIAGTARLKEGKSAEDVEKARTVPVMLMGHACSIRGGNKPAAQQTVAEIKPLAEGTTFEPPWDQAYFRFPLPDFVEGQTWVVDFRSITFTHFKNLEEARVCTLSLAGLAALQRRYVNHVARIDVPLEPGGSARRVYNEITVWERWIERGHDATDFAEWLAGPLGGESPYAGQIRRDLLELAVDYLLDDVP